MKNHQILVLHCKARPVVNENDFIIDSSLNHSSTIYCKLSKLNFKRICNNLIHHPLLPSSFLYQDYSKGSGIYKIRFSVSLKLARVGVWAVAHCKHMLCTCRALSWLLCMAWSPDPHSVWPPPNSFSKRGENDTKNSSGFTKGTGSHAHYFPALGIQYFLILKCTLFL